MDRVAKNIPKILIAAATLLFIMLSILLTLLILNPADRDERFSEYMEAAIEGPENKSSGLMMKASRYAYRAAHWKELLYHGLLYGESTQEWKLLTALSKKALKDFPGREDFRATYAAALLWSGKADKAESVSMRLSAERFETLKGEIFLVQESLRINPDIEPYNGVLQTLDEIRDAEYYEKIAQITGNQPLKTDAALLWLQLGELERAYLLTKDIAHSQIPDQIPGYIAYDWGDLERAHAYLTNQLLVDQSNHNERWTLNAMLGDISFQLKQWDEAERYYRRAMEIHEEGYWRTGLNLSVLYDLRDLRKVSWKIMEEVLLNNPDQGEVLTHFLYYWREEYPVVSERMVLEYIKEFPGDLNMQLNRLSFFPRQISPEQYSAYLWELFNQDSADKEIATFLLNYLIASGDFQGASLVLERHRRVNLESHWTGGFEAIIFALQSSRNIPIALETLEQSMDLRSQWYVEFNRSVLLFQNGEIVNALKILDESEIKRQEVLLPENRELEAKICALYSRIYLALDNPQRARDYALKGLEWDQGNLDARSLLLELKELNS